jgi:hypothetical protein
MIKSQWALAEFNTFNTSATFRKKRRPDLLSRQPGFLSRISTLSLALQPISVLATFTLLQPTLPFLLQFKYITWYLLVCKTRWHQLSRAMQWQNPAARTAAIVTTKIKLASQQTHKTIKALSFINGCLLMWGKHTDLVTIRFARLTHSQSPRSQLWGNTYTETLEQYL